MLRATHPTFQPPRHHERGIAVLTFAVSFVVLFSVLALVLEVGWAHYLQKKAQTAADAAAVAGLTQALATVGPDGSIVCGTVMCQQAAACPSAGALQTACLYAQANGFSPGGGDLAAQSVQVSAGTTNRAPGVPN